MEATMTTNLMVTMATSALLMDNEQATSDTGNPYVLPWWWQISWTLVFGLMMAVATVGNALVIWAVLCHRLMRCPTNYFLVSVSAADLLMATLNGLFNFIYMLHSHWPFGRPYCTLNNFVANWTIAASVFSLVAISCDRYTAIMHPLKPRITRRLAIVLTATIWMCSALLSLPNLLYSTVYTHQYKDGTVRHLCILLWPDGPSIISKQEHMYSIVCAVLTYVLPMMAMFVVYIKMGRELWGSTVIGECRDRQIGNIKTKRRVVRMFIFVVVIFAICWLPYHVYFVYMPLRPEIIQTDFIQHIFLAFYWLAMSSTMYNPIIYYKMNSRFRRYFLTALTCGYKSGSAQMNNVHSSTHSGTYHGYASTNERQATIIMRMLSESGARGQQQQQQAAIVINGGQRSLKKNTAGSASNGVCNGKLVSTATRTTNSNAFGQSPSPDDNTATVAIL